MVSQWNRGSFYVLLPLALGLLLAFTPRPAQATFHLMEISRIMVGHNGDTDIQAVELRMLSSGQNSVNGTSIRTYDAAGNPLATLGTFAADLPIPSVADQRILCATSKFQTTFSITADLTIAPGIPVGTGQVSFEIPLCFVDAIAYGNVTVVKNGPSSAFPLYKDLAYVLVRTASNGTIPSCPLAEDAAARMTLQSGTSAAPIVFRNYHGDSAPVFSTLTDAGGLPRTNALSIHPNPVRSSARVTAPSHRRISIHDLQGRLIRVLASGQERTMSPFEGTWDGKDFEGRFVASGVYFVRYDAPSGPVARRFVVTR